MSFGAANKMLPHLSCRMITVNHIAPLTYINRNMHTHILSTYKLQEKILV